MMMRLIPHHVHCDPKLGVQHLSASTDAEYALENCTAYTDSCMFWIVLLRVLLSNQSLAWRYTYLFLKCHRHCALACRDVQ
eukprot:3483148-Pleurochrysis_carterae.AAC.1